MRPPAFNAATKKASTAFTEGASKPICAAVAFSLSSVSNTYDWLLHFDFSPFLLLRNVELRIIYAKANLISLLGDISIAKRSQSSKIKRARRR